MKLYDHRLTDEEYVQFMEEGLFPRQSLLNYADGSDLAAVPDNPITKAILDFRHVLIHFQDSPSAETVHKQFSDLLHKIMTNRIESKNAQRQNQASTGRKRTDHPSCR